MTPYSSMADELEKIAAGPHIEEMPGLRKYFGIGGKQFSHEVASSAPDLRDLYAKRRKSRSGMVVLEPQADLEPLVGNKRLAESNYRATRRHELIHWKRQKDGKMKDVGQAGLRNVLRTGREEAAAYLGAMKKVHPEHESMAAKALGSQWLGSMRQAYPKGIRRAAMGGTLKRLVPLAEKLKLIR
jgi:hypothetical protein